MEHDEIVRVYGPWRPHSVADVVALLDGYGGSWWIAGGWAIEAFSGVRRQHGDIDVGVPRRESRLLREHVIGRLDVWAAEKGALRPLLSFDDPLSTTCNNLWLRRSGADPWEYDVTLTDVADSRWVYRRDTRVELPWADVLWQRDGVDYLCPEVQLLYKAPGLRPQDQLDFDASLPSLSASNRRWLRFALTTAHPGHPWISALSAP